MTIKINVFQEIEPTYDFATSVYFKQSHGCKIIMVY